MTSQTPLDVRRDRPAARLAGRGELSRGQGVLPVEGRRLAAADRAGAQRVQGITRIRERQRRPDILQGRAASLQPQHGGRVFHS